MARWDEGRKAFCSTPGKKFTTGIEDAVKATRSGCEARGMQMSTRGLQKHQHLLREELHRSPRTAG